MFRYYLGIHYQRLTLLITFTLSHCRGLSTGHWSPICSIIVSSFACIKYTSTFPIVQTFSTLFSLLRLINNHSK